MNNSTKASSNTNSNPYTTSIVLDNTLNGLSTTSTLPIDSSSVLSTSSGSYTIESGGSTLSWTSSPSYATLGYVDANLENDNLPSFFSFLKEEEIEEIFDKIIERSNENDSIVKDSISAIIKKRHFSEDFLMKYFNYTTIEVIMRQHKADINSQNYTELVLLIEGLK